MTSIPCHLCVALILLALAAHVEAFPSTSVGTKFWGCHHDETFGRPTQLWDRRKGIENENELEGKTSVSNDNGDSLNDPKLAKEKDQGVTLEEMDWETSMIEQQASRKVWNSLMAPYLFGNIVNTAAWTFVGVGILLNIFGYTYVLKDGHLTVGTYEEQRFQAELHRGLRESTRNTPP